MKHSFLQPSNSLPALGQLTTPSSTSPCLAYKCGYQSSLRGSERSVCGDGSAKVACRFGRCNGSSRILHSSRVELFHPNFEVSVEPSRLSIICREVPTRGREWKEYESAGQDVDFDKTLELLEVLSSFESDAINSSGVLKPPSTLVDDSRLSTSVPRTPAYLPILDLCEGSKNLTLVGKTYDWLRGRGFLPNFGKFKASASDGERLVTEDVLKQSIGLGASKLAPKKWGLSGDSAVLLFVGCAFWSFLVNSGAEIRPVVAVILAFGIYDAIYLGGSGLTQIQSMWLPHRRRVLVHEAGHVLVAYLLGCPVRGVILDPIQAVKMQIQGQAGTQFWDETLQEELSENRLTGATVDRYSIVLFAGIAAEAMVYGEAEGGESDENMFKSLASQLQPSWSPAKMSNQARWAVLQAYKLLTQNKKAHEELVEALDNNAGLGSMVRIIEESMA